MNKIKRLNERYRALLSQRDSINEELDDIRDSVRNMLGVGDSFTIYNVKACVVKKHTRRGFKAVRVKR